METNESQKPMVYQIAEFLGRSPGYQLAKTQNQSKELKENGLK